MASIVLCCVLCGILGFVIDYTILPRFPDAIPSVGYGRGFWGHIRSNIGYFTSQRRWIRDGYNKYNKRGLPFLAPAGMSRPHDVVLPRSMLSWLIQQPEDAVDARTAHNTIIYGDYNFLDARVVRDSFGMRAIHKSLNRNLPGLLPAIDDEVQYAVNMTLSHVSDTWTSVNLWDMWLKIVPPITNRMLVGPSACRDGQFLEAMVAFTHAVLRNCVLLRMFPLFLHPVLGRVLTISNWIYWRRAYQRVGPVIKTRLDHMQRKAEGESQLRDWLPPEDFITWLIRLALEEDRRIELDALIISKRLLPIEFAAIDTTVLTGLLWIQDLLMSPSVIDALTAELRTHQPAPGDTWSKEALLSLFHVDSSIRESQRLSNFHLTLIERVVMVPGGLRLPNVGWTLPKGAHLTVNLDGSHHDEDLYNDACKYDAFRFSRIREGGGECDNSCRDGAKPLGMAAMNDHHFPFGHGKHTCPGRFFVAHEFRLIAAHLLLNFDLMEDEAPRRKWVGSGMIPPFGSRIKIRRKQSLTG
ncbi:ent-kaurene oxidase [Whalleya microplaca]|nr:ent-kaurene oxidase [Whalleya microplaca]